MIIFYPKCSFMYIGFNVPGQIEFTTGYGVHHIYHELES